MLIIKNLTKTYSDKKKQIIPALDNVDLTINAGMFGLLGPNGAGKSSLMRTIATLQKPDSGSISLFNKDIVKNPSFMRQRLGYLPQEFGVYPGVTAYDLLEYLAKLKGISNNAYRKNQVETLLEKVNLIQHKNSAVNKFSGGMKQRFGIAQALLGDPDIIVVDEPTAGLDPEERNRFHNILVDISQSKAVLLSTHIVEDVSDLCPNMAILESGKIIRQDTPSNIIDEVKGKIWRTCVSNQESQNILEDHCVISQRFISGEVNFHVYSEQNPGFNFEQVSPDLEDAYFTVLHRQRVSATLGE